MNLIQRLKEDSLDSILNSILRSKHRLHKQEFRDTIDWIYNSWKESKTEHERKVFRGAYKKFCDTYTHTFGEIYHNSLQRDIRQDIRDAKVKVTFKHNIYKLH